jgi:GxxExxY protein
MLMEINKITEQVLSCAFKVHSALGPGLLESAYEEWLFYEIKDSGLSVKKQFPLPLIYKEVVLECGYRADLFVEKKVTVEVKSVEALNDIHIAQVLTYLKLAKSTIGLLINFNTLHLKTGIKRIANKYVEE